MVPQTFYHQACRLMGRWRALTDQATDNVFKHSPQAVADRPRGIATTVKTITQSANGLIFPGFGPFKRGSREHARPTGRP
mgnify:FL=1